MRGVGLGEWTMTKGHSIDLRTTATGTSWWRAAFDGVPNRRWPSSL